MASPPYSQNYGAATSPSYPAHTQLPPTSRKRPSDMGSAPAVKRRKPSLMSTTSSHSIHPLRQTSFPPSPGGRSPSVDAMSLVSGSIAGAVVKKKRGRKLKNAEDSASIAGGAAPTAVSGTSGRGGQLRGLSADDDDDVGEGMDVAVVSRTKEEKEKEKQHRAMLVAAFDEDQFKRYEVWRSSRLSDSIVRRLINQTLSQSVPASVILAVKSVTKIFAGEIIESARRVQLQWLELSQESQTGLKSPPSSDSDDLTKEKRRGPLTADHLREALRRYKLERRAGNVGLLGLARHNHAPGVERFGLRTAGRKLLL